MGEFVLFVMEVDFLKRLVFEGYDVIVSIVEEVFVVVE